MGRKPKPTALKVLGGCFRNVNPHEPQPEVSIPDPPPHIKGLALEEWNRIIPQLFKLGMLTQIDRTALAAYCDAYRTYTESTAALERNGRQMTVIKTTQGNIIPNPLLGIRNRAMDLMHKFATEFGMTPVARSRVIARQPEKKGEDKWAKFGGKRKKS